MFTYTHIIQITVLIGVVVLLKYCYNDIVTVIDTITTINSNRQTSKLSAARKEQLSANILFSPSIICRRSATRYQQLPPHAALTTKDSLSHGKIPFLTMD